MDLADAHLESIKEASNVKFCEAKGNFESLISKNVQLKGCFLVGVNLGQITIPFKDLVERFSNCIFRNTGIHLTYLTGNIVQIYKSKLQKLIETGRLDGYYANDAYLPRLDEIKEKKEEILTEYKYYKTKMKKESSKKLLV